MISLTFLEISTHLKSFSFPEVDVVIGIGSGGIVPATLVAHQLGKPLQIIGVNYRDEKNNPRYEDPKVLTDYPILSNKNRILLVDDVAVSGKTLQTVLKQFKAFQVFTFVLKGKADFVLFPEIPTCVKWPWKV
ncbi:MAG: phosphoribosyltransferase [Bacteroidetes bacterium]|nr:phosphoribosyltransferase [Bacteroidota bacterium]